jgi:signal transduction histidine kinase/ActR/RegA family two-component response regulator
VEGSAKAANVVPGDELRIVGQTARGGYMPNIAPGEITITGHPGMPPPLSVDWDDLWTNRHPNVRVRVSGTLIGVREGNELGLHFKADTVQMRVEGHRLPALIRLGEGKRLAGTIGSEVRFDGVLSLEYNLQQRRRGPLIFVEDLTDWSAAVVQAKSPWEGTELYRIDRLFRHLGDTTDGRRARVRGVVTYASGPLVFLQQGSGGAEVSLSLARKVSVGDSIEAVGSIGWTREGNLQVTNALVRPAPPEAPPKPYALDAAGLLLPRVTGSLVTVDGECVQAIRLQGIWTIMMEIRRENGPPVEFEAQVPADQNLLPEPGDRVRLTGILDIFRPRTRRGNSQLRILMRTPGDLLILRSAPWWRKVDWLSVGLGASLAVGLVFVWVWALRREVRQQTKVLAEKSRQLESAMVAAQAANDAKTEFLANMSHEIRTPMNGVLGMISLALETSREPALKEDLSWARRSAESLLSILNNILDLSKIESGKMQIAAVPFDLRALLDETAHTMAPNARAKGLDLDLEIVGAFEHLVVGDPIRLRQILLNLVSNAIKFTESGWIQIGVEEREASRVGFTIRDTGIGIASEKQAAVFEPFVQADSSSSRRFGGTGLGLPISLRLLKLMGSTMKLKSESGRGSEFSFELELPPSAKASGALDFGPHAEGGTVRELSLLVAEDNAVNQRLIQRLLERQGHRVTLAENGCLAVACFKAQSFDLVLMDIQMPDMDGFEATQAIRALPGGDVVPILAVTAHAIIGYEQTCLSRGMDGYLSKSLQETELRQALAKFASGVRNTPVPAGDSS